MKSKIYGFKEFDNEDLYFSSTNDHARDLLEGLTIYYSNFYKVANDNSYYFQCTNLKELLKLVDILKKAQEQLSNIYED